MSFIEFVEALARVAERISPSSPAHKEKNLGLRKRRVLPLFVKFEGLCFMLYHFLKAQFYKQYPGNEKILAFDKKIVASSIL
jgi:hypothetical protein